MSGSPRVGNEWILDGSFAPGVVLGAGALAGVDLEAEGFRATVTDSPPRWVNGLAVRLPDRYDLEVLRRDLEVVGVVEFDQEHPTDWFDEALNLGYLNVVVGDQVGRVPVIA